MYFFFERMFGSTDLKTCKLIVLYKSDNYHIKSLRRDLKGLLANGLSKQRQTKKTTGQYEKSRAHAISPRRLRVRKHCHM